MITIKSIVCGVESLSANYAALEHATTIAKANKSKLKVIDVIKDDYFAWLGIGIAHHEMLEQERRNRLQDILKPLQTSMEGVSGEVIRGRPAIEIIKHALKERADLVIKNAAGATSNKPLLIGPTDMRLLRNCPCPVWLVATNKAKPHKNVLAAVDPQAHDEEHISMNRKIIELASSLATAESAKLHIVSAWEVPGESLLAGRIPKERLHKYTDELKQVASQKLAGLLEEFGLSIKTEHVYFCKDEATEAILKAVKTSRCDLLVMGTVSKSGIESFLMGNTAEAVLRQINCSMLTVKPEGFVTPVKL